MGEGGQQHCGESEGYIWHRVLMLKQPWELGFAVAPSSPCLHGYDLREGDPGGALSESWSVCSPSHLKTLVVCAQRVRLVQVMQHEKEPGDIVSIKE